jgi:hypothetical protein
LPTSIAEAVPTQACSLFDTPVIMYSSLHRNTKEKIKEFNGIKYGSLGKSIKLINV